MFHSPKGPGILDPNIRPSWIQKVFDQQQIRGSIFDGHSIMSEQKLLFDEEQRGSQKVTLQERDKMNGNVYSRRIQRSLEETNEFLIYSMLRYFHKKMKERRLMSIFFQHSKIQRF